MIDWAWIRAAGDAPLMIVISAVALYALLILYTRPVGLRSFSKMSGFDFAITIAIGSVLASVTLWQKPTLWDGAVALGTLFPSDGGTSKSPGRVHYDHRWPERILLCYDHRPRPDQPHRGRSGRQPRKDPPVRTSSTGAGGRARRVS
ncbi:MAG: hypothetical protein R6T83_02135 [Salinibacter sp.]